MCKKLIWFSIMMVFLLSLISVNAVVYDEVRFETGEGYVIENISGQPGESGNNWTITSSPDNSSIIDDSGNQVAFTQDDGFSNSVWTYKEMETNANGTYGVSFKMKDISGSGNNRIYFGVTTGAGSSLDQGPMVLMNNGGGTVKAGLLFSNTNTDCSTVGGEWNNFTMFIDEDTKTWNLTANGDVCSISGNSTFTYVDPADLVMFGFKVISNFSAVFDDICVADDLDECFTFNVTHDSPANETSYNEDTNITFSFNVTDVFNPVDYGSNISCDLNLDDVLNQSKEFSGSPWSNPLSFDPVLFEQSLVDVEYNWTVNCTQGSYTGSTDDYYYFTMNGSGIPSTPTLNSPANGTITDADWFLANATCTVNSGNVSVNWFLDGVNVANGSSLESPNTDTYNFSSLNYSEHNWTAECTGDAGTGTRADEWFLTTRLEVTNLEATKIGIDYINWTWTNPVNSEWNGTNYVSVDGGVYVEDMENFYYIDGLGPGMEHNISIISTNGVFNGSTVVNITSTLNYDSFNCSALPIPFCTMKNWTGTPQCYQCGNLRSPISCVTCGINGWRIRD